MRHLKSGAAFAFYSSILTGIGLILVELSSKSIGPITTLAYVQILGGILLALIAWLTKPKLEIKKLFSRYRRELMEIILTRNIIGQVMIFYGFSLTTAIKGGFLTRFEPIFVAVMGLFFLGEKIRKRGIAAILIIVIGAVILSTSGNLSQIGNANIGDAIVVLAMLSFAYSYIPARKIKTVNPLTVAFASTLIAGLILFISLPFIGATIIVTSLEGWGMIFGMAFLFQSIAMYLFYGALKKTKAWIVSSILSIQAIVTALLAYLFLGQTLSLIQIVGGLLIMGASIFVTYESMAEKN